jgi:hypothetical protein
MIEPNEQIDPPHPPRSAGTWVALVVVWTVGVVSWMVWIGLIGLLAYRIL